MEHEALRVLRQRSAAWQLLRADNAPLVLGFLGRVFVEENVRELPASALVDLLEDELHALRHRLGADAYPRSAKAYLDDWSSEGAGWLRKYYRAGSQEPHFDATPDLEKAVAFVATLRARDFVGTESRLNTLVELLRQLAYGTELDPARRLASLQQQRAAIDAEIERVERGDLAVLDSAGQRDRLQQFATTARELLGDFRQVEANFRDLDRDLRAQIAAWEGSKGELLEGAVSTRGAIGESDQGRSFAAFYDLLLSADRQNELGELLEHALSLDVAKGADPRLRYVHHDWLAAGERTQATVRMLSEQLRRFLDDRVWLENKRIVELLRSVEARAYALRGDIDALPGMPLEEMSPRVVLPMERRLYAPKERVPISSAVAAGDDSDVDATTLFEQVHVDTAVLAEGVRDDLARQPAVTLAAVLARRPLQQGLGELVGYLTLADQGFGVVFDPEATESVRWSDEEGTVRVATVPRVSFVRAGPTGVAHA